MPESGVDLLLPVTVFQGGMPAFSLVILLQLTAPLALSHLLIYEVEQKQNNKEAKTRRNFQFPMAAFIPKLSMQFWS